MKWWLVLGLGVPFGLLMGVGLVMGWPWYFVRGTLIAVVVLSGVILARAGGKPFAHGFLTGLLAGALQAGLGLALWNQTTRSHPGAVKLFCASPWLNLAFMALLLVSVSVIYGLLIGLSSWMFFRLFGLAKGAKAAGSKGD